MRTLCSKWSGQTASRRGANSKRSRPKRDWSWTVIVGLISNSPTSCRRILRASTAIRFRKSAPDGRQSLRRERPDILPRKPGPMIIYSSRFLTRGEVWFDEEPGNIRSLDWILYNLRSSPAPGARWRYFYNYVIDLTQSAEQLQAQLKEDMAYKIRRARDRDKIVCECCDPNDPAVLDRFEETYNPFAAMKGLPPLDRARMNSMAAAGALDLSVAKDPQGNALVYHANYRDHARATELHLPSLFRKLSDSAARNLIGRANRYLTWKIGRAHV